MPTELLNTQTLPENAYKPLHEGELYLPIVPPSAQLPELTARAILWGILFCVMFSVASAYSTLKVGQGMEATTTGALSSPCRRYVQTSTSWTTRKWSTNCVLLVQANIRIL